MPNNFTPYDVGARRYGAHAVSLAAVEACDVAPQARADAASIDTDQPLLPQLRALLGDAASTAHRDEFDALREESTLQSLITTGTRAEFDAVIALHRRGAIDLNTLDFRTSYSDACSAVEHVVDFAFPLKRAASFESFRSSALTGSAARSGSSSESVSMRGARDDEASSSWAEARNGAASSSSSGTRGSSASSSSTRAADDALSIRERIEILSRWQHELVRDNAHQADVFETAHNALDRKSASFDVLAECLIRENAVCRTVLSGLVHDLARKGAQTVQADQARIQNFERRALGLSVHPPLSGTGSAPHEVAQRFLACWIDSAGAGRCDCSPELVESALSVGDDRHLERLSRLDARALQTAFRAVKSPPVLGQASKRFIAERPVLAQRLLDHAIRSKRSDIAGFVAAALLEHAPRIDDGFRFDIGRPSFDTTALIHAALEQAIERKDERMVKALLDPPSLIDAWDTMRLSIGVRPFGMPPFEHQKLSLLDLLKDAYRAGLPGDSDICTRLLRHCGRHGLYEVRMNDVRLEREAHHVFATLKNAVGRSSFARDPFLAYFGALTLGGGIGGGAGAYGGAALTTARHTSRLVPTLHFDAEAIAATIVLAGTGAALGVVAGHVGYKAALMASERSFKTQLVETIDALHAEAREANDNPV